PHNNHSCHLFSLGRLSATPCKIFLDSRQSLVNKPLTPSRHLARVDSKKRGHGFVLSSSRRHQHDLGSLHRARGGSPPARPTAQRLDFTFRKFNRLGYSHGTLLLKLISLRRRINSINSETLH